MSKLSATSLNVRPYTEDDFPAVVAFIAMTQEYERAVMPNRRMGGLVAVPYAKFLLHKPERVVLMACLSGAPIGYIAAYPESDPDELIEPDTRPHMFVSDLFVLPNWRRMGVAARLVEALENEFRQRSMARIRICGVASNEAALGFYKKAGFNPYEVVYEKLLAKPTHVVVDGRVVRQG
jgi:ribosomal protein S18 acetylase RimI-like enzyme